MAYTNPVRYGFTIRYFRNLGNTKCRWYLDWTALSKVLGASHPDKMVFLLLHAGKIAFNLEHYACIAWRLKTGNTIPIIYHPKRTKQRILLLKRFETKTLIWCSEYYCFSTSCSHTLCSIYYCVNRSLTYNSPGSARTVRPSVLVK